MRNSLLFVLFCILVAGCSSKKDYERSAEELFQKAEEDYKDEQYISAEEKYRALKTKFPYSKRVTEAELKIADCYFHQESYYEAEAAYDLFKELHPTHSQIAYVQYQIGLSNYNQIPGNSARDLTPADKAIRAFKVLLDKYPSSSYADKAKDHILGVRKTIAEHENYVANFYYQKSQYLSSSYRYASLLKDFENLGYDEEALFRLGRCYYQISMFENAKDTFKQLLNKFPESKFKKDATSHIETIR